MMDIERFLRVSSEYLFHPPQARNDAAAQRSSATLFPLQWSNKRMPMSPQKPKGVSLTR